MKFYAARRKQVTKKPVTEVVAEFLKVKAVRAASARHLDGLTSRLNRFAGNCTKGASNVTPADVQDWLDCRQTRNARKHCDSEPCRSPRLTRRQHR